MLKLHQTEETNNEQLLILQANCEELKDRNNQLTNELWYSTDFFNDWITFFRLFRMSNQKILELEATLKDTTSSTEIPDLKNALNRATARHEEESIRNKNQIDELQKRLDNAGKSKHFSSILFVNKTEFR